LRAFSPRKQRRTGACLPRDAGNTKDSNRSDRWLGPARFFRDRREMRHARSMFSMDANPNDKNGTATIACPSRSFREIKQIRKTTGRWLGLACGFAGRRTKSAWQSELCSSRWLWVPTNKINLRQGHVWPAAAARKEHHQRSARSLCFARCFVDRMTKTSGIRSYVCLLGRRFRQTKRN
jgi:hypothetical protein